MDLMTSITNYEILKKKYYDFRAPTYKIIVNNLDLTAKKDLVVSDLTVELTVGYEASAASFDVLHEYVPSNTDFDEKKSYKYLQIGAKIEIELGYINTETVFYGLITGVKYIFEEDEPPYIHVECMDVKCLLMKSQRLEVRKETKIEQVVNALLSEAPVSSYLKGKSVTLRTAKVDSIRINMENDYDYIVKQAQYSGCEFFVFAGKVYFRNSGKLSAPIYSMSMQKDLINSSLSLTGAGLVKELEVVGINPENNEPITSSMKLKGKFSLGSYAKNMINGTKRTYFDTNVSSSANAKKRATTLTESIQNDFAVFEAQSIGMPEIVPGRYVKIEDMMGLTKNKKIYITNVVHQINDDGYLTLFEGRLDTL